MTGKFVRKYTPLGALGLATFGSAMHARAANLLTNPGFESPSVGTTESTVATGWTFYQLGEAERAQFFVRSGQWSVFQKIFDPTGGVQQLVTGIVGGTPYTLSGWEFAEANAASTMAMLDFRLTWENSSGTAIGTPSALQIPASSVSTTGFTQFILDSTHFSTADSTVNGSTAGTPDNIVYGAPTAPSNATQVLVSFNYNGPGDSGQNLSTFLDDVDLEGAGTPPANAWSINGSGDWNVGGNWSNGAVPNGAGQEADFFGALLTANHNVFTDVAVTAGTLNFNNGHTYVIDGAGSLTLQGAGSNNAQVIVQVGTQELNVPLTIASNTVFNVSSGAALIIGNPLTVNTGKSVTQTGSGTVTYNSIITLQTGASLAFGNATHATSLNLQGSAAASVVAHVGSTPTLLQVDSLSLAGSTSTLDLTNNALIVTGGSLSTVFSELKTGFNAGHWNGTTGIISASASSDTRHLTALGSRQSGGGTFDGANTTTADVLVKYTYYGDADLNGTVNGADYSQIDNGFGMHLTGWQNGDFNYDGVVDGSDYSLIDNTFNQISATGASPLAVIASPADLNAGVNAVPEPATLGLLGMGAIGLLGRRRRRTA
jgi:hypothetical protein